MNDKNEYESLQKTIKNYEIHNSNLNVIYCLQKNSDYCLEIGWVNSVPILLDNKPFIELFHKTFFPKSKHEIIVLKYNENNPTIYRCNDNRLNNNEMRQTYQKSTDLWRINSEMIL